MTRYFNTFEGPAGTGNLNVSGFSPWGGTPPDIGTNNAAGISTALLSPAAAHGPGMGLRITMFSVACAGFEQWYVHPATATQRITLRVYFTADNTATPAGTFDPLAAVYDTTSGTALAMMKVCWNLGALVLQDAAGATLSTSPALAAGTQYRLEAYAQPGTTTSNGSLGVAVYVGDSLTPFWTFTGSANNVGIKAAQYITIGRNVVMSGIARVLDVDDVAFDDGMTSGWIGPNVPTLTVTADPTNTPPQFEVTLGSPDGSPMTAAVLYRVANGRQVVTRVQPSPGVASVSFADPEAPWDTPVAYSATISYAGGLISATGSSAAAVLTPAVPCIWGIHPTNPALSMVLDAGLFSQLGIAQDGDLVYAAQAVQHKIIGSKLPILTKIGTRLAPSWSLDLTSTTLQELSALLALLDDETPILIRAPSAWGWAIPEGYYAVGDVDVARRLQYGPEPSRTVKLPMQQVAPPAGVQVSSWGWGGLMSAYPDWPSVQAAYADWGKVAGNQPT